MSPADFSITFQAEEKAQKPWGKSLICFKNSREVSGVKGVRRREATRLGNGSHSEGLGFFTRRKVSSRLRDLSRKVTGSDPPFPH